MIYNLQHTIIFLSGYAVLMFEFIQDHYIVNEDEGSVVLNVHFVFGIIEAYNIRVVVSTTDGSAVGGRS